MKGHLQPLIPPQQLFEYYATMAKKCDVLKKLTLGEHSQIFQEAEQGFLDKAEFVLNQMNSTIEG